MNRKTRSIISRATCIESLETRMLLSFSPVGLEFQANTFPANTLSTSIAADADGDFVIVWGEGNSSDIYFRRFDAAGVAQGLEVRANVYASDSQRNPEVAMDADGDFVVVWERYGADDDSGVFARRFSAAGVPQGGDFRVNTTTAGSQNLESVAMDSAGNFVITWLSDTDVFAQRYNAIGLRQGTEFRVNTFTTGSQSQAMVGMDADGDFVVAWRSDAQDGSDSGVYAKRYNELGVVQGAEFLVNTFTTSFQGAPSVAMDLSGDFAIAWGSINQDGVLSGVYAQRYSAAGVAQGAEFRVNTTTTAYEGFPTISMDADGDFLVAWQSTTQDGSGYGVYAQSFNAAGVPQGSEFRVNTFTTNSQLRATVTLDHEGDAVVVWSSYRDNDYGVYAQRYDQAPDTAGPTITDLLIGEESVAPGERVVQHPSSLKMNVSEDLATSGAGSALLTSNYSLTRDGVSFPINAAEFSLNTTTSKYEAELFFATDLTDGRYVVTARQTLTDLSGNLLDGNLNGAPGGNFARAFTIAVPAAVGPEFRANSTTTSIQTSPAVAAAANGDFVIAWQSSGQDGSGYGIYAQRYNAIGQPQGGEFLVNTFTTTNQLDPSVAMDSDGDFVITWRSDSHDGSGFGIFAQRFNAVGVAQGPEFRANTFTTGSQIDPEVAMDAAGDFVIAWASSGQDNSHYGVYAQRYNALGVPQGTEFRVNTFTTNEQSEPAVAMDADGDFVVAWESFGQDAAGGFGIFAQRYSAAGIRQGAEFPVNNHTPNNQRNCSIAMDAEGDIVVTWESLGQIGSGYNLYVRRFSAAGMPLTPEFLANASLTKNARRPSIAMDSDGDFVIAWEATADNAIYANLFNATGESIGVEFRVNTFTPGQHTLAAAAIDADGDYVVAWNSPQQDGSSNGVYAQRFGSVLAPIVSAPTFLFQTDPHRLRYTFDQNVSASLGTDDLLLENLTTSTTIPSSDFSLAYNTATNLSTFSYIGPGEAIAGVLPDGNYRATLIASGITSANGIPLPANHVFNFFFLNGDANRDGIVNVNDFTILASNFGQTGRVFSQGDFNYDTIVNVNDFTILASRFGATLAPPSASSLFGGEHIGGARVNEDRIVDMLA